MREIYFKDYRGDMHTMSIEQYERARSITKRKTTTGKDPGFPIREAGGEDPTETDNQKPLSGMEAGKKTYATKTTSLDLPDSGTDNTGITE